AGININRCTMNTKRIGQAKYSARAPASNGPKPRPSILIALATIEASPCFGFGTKFTNVAVAVLVNSPAENPDNIRPTNKSVTLSVTRKTIALTADNTTPGNKIYLRPIRSDSWPNTSSALITPTAYTA